MTYERDQPKCTSLAQDLLSEIKKGASGPYLLGSLGLTSTCMYIRARVVGKEMPTAPPQYP